MEQIKKFLRGKGFALVLAACLMAAAAAGVWAVRTVRDELQKNLDSLNPPNTTQQTEPETEPDWNDWNAEEDPAWQQPVTDAANSMANVPQAASSSAQSGSSASSGAVSGSGSVREPSALQGASSPASSAAQPASAPSAPGRVLNAYSGDELVYNKTLGDWRTHNGVDYACTQGSAVAAPTSGKVTYAGPDGNWGTVVEIADSEGRSWRLCGVASPSVKVGDTVEAGQKLGTAGGVSCECAEESHIHLEVKQGETYLDPAKLFQ